MKSKREELGLQERRAAARTRTAGELRSQLCLDLESDVELLSPAGMMIRLDLKPDLGSRHEFTLGFSGRSIDVAGAVRDVREVIVDGAPHYEVGLEFEGITAAQRDFIEAFLAGKSGG